jgi:putative RNA 2'-phosphotransferase
MPRRSSRAPNRTVAVSKRLSFVLRHRPDRIGVTLDEAGWVDVETLLTALAEHGRPLTRAELERVVADNDKQRFTIDAATDRIRANQGHSVPVELGYVAVEPPPLLYHGTPARNVSVILQEGLKPGDRHDVHLSPDVQTARRVGARRGQAVVLVVDAGALARDGARFARSANGVWLVAHVPSRYLRVLE